MEYVIGILLLVSFFGLVVYAVRGGNLMLGIFVMGVIWTVLPMIGNTFATNPDFIAANKDAVSITWIEALEKTFQSGPEGWGATLVNVIFGAWFGRVLMNTGIASTLIRTTTELGGDKPALTCILPVSYTHLKGKITAKQVKKAYESHWTDGAREHMAVSYTHLDVYKRQSHG